MSVFVTGAEFGVVRYIGHTAFAEGVWLGIELRRPSEYLHVHVTVCCTCVYIHILYTDSNVHVYMCVLDTLLIYLLPPYPLSPTLPSLSGGKNDGTVKGKRYFHCKPLFGLFVKPEKATHRGINCAKILPDTFMEKST